jgi:hypothetical protein
MTIEQLRRLAKAANALADWTEKDDEILRRMYVAGREGEPLRKEWKKRHALYSGRMVMARRTFLNLVKKMGL